MTSTKKVVLAGATGYIGSRLVDALVARGDEAVVLTRDADTARTKGRPVQWDGKSMGSWVQELERADAVVNLAGSSIGVKWTPENKQRIIQSRVEPTRMIGAAISLCSSPPAVWINASATGFYGDAGDNLVDESSPSGQGFLSESCRAWEQALRDATVPDSVYRVAMRIGVVLGQNSPFLQSLEPLVKWFLGGATGSGRQWISWIQIDDLVALIIRSLESPFADVVNAVSPNPVRNADFMSALRKELRRPWSPPVPAFAIQAVVSLVGPDPSLVLGSTRAVPRAALDHGFEFTFAELNNALEASLSSSKGES